MSLYMILYAAGAIVGVWGPLPYDETECHARREERMAEVRQIIETGRGVKGNPVPDEMLAHIRTWRMSCEQHAKRPALTRKDSK